MYTNTSGTPSRIDTVAAREGTFQLTPDGQPQVEVRLAYMNRERAQEGWGFFDARSQMFSPKTLEAFRHFMECVEEDVGQLLFSEGATVLPTGQAEAESAGGLNFKGLGEK